MDSLRSHNGSRSKIRIVAALFFLGCLGCEPPVQVHSVLSEHAVLQEGVPLSLSGTTTRSEPITVEIQGQEVSALPEEGKWQVSLQPLNSGGPFRMKLKQADFRHEWTDLWVGEVWLCGGQSNMRLPLIQTESAGAAIAASTDPQLRLLDIPVAASKTPRAIIQNAAWLDARPATVKSFSAVCYYFGKYLRSLLQKPIGLIHATRDGSVAEAWVSKSTLAQHPDLKPLLDLPVSTDPYEAYDRPVGYYNGMIAPLQSYPIRGAIWYQGESNAGMARLYQTLFPVLISSWRKQWGGGDFPFLFVQLAPFQKIASEPQQSTWAELREAQALTQARCHNTAMAVITDAGDENDIHPKRKEIVGLRLGVAAESLVYGRKRVYSGPLFEKMERVGREAILSFKEVGSGLQVQGEILQGFTIAGEDGKFVQASARLRGNQVVVESPLVSSPAAVRYGWATYPVGNLYNKEGFPASPFRTDRPDFEPRLTGCPP